MQAKMYPNICTHHKLHNNNENKFPVFAERIYNKWQNMMYNKHLRHTTMEKYDNNWERWILTIWLS